MTLLLPNSELVACGWLANVPGFTAGMVGTTLPQMPASGPLPAWVATGFVTVGPAVGGSPGAFMPTAEPVLSINCWAVNATQSGGPTGPINVGSKPPWGKAAQLAERIRQAVYTLDKGSTRQVTMPVTGYARATVNAASMLSEPRRMPSDLASYARTQFEIQLFWIGGTS